jgi:hypothetical protein
MCEAGCRAHVKLSWYVALNVPAGTYFVSQNHIRFSVLCSKGIFILNFVFGIITPSTAWLTIFNRRLLFSV